MKRHTYVGEYTYDPTTYDYYLQCERGFIRSLCSTTIAYKFTQKKARATVWASGFTATRAARMLAKKFGLVMSVYLIQENGGEELRCKVQPPPIVN